LPKPSSTAGDWSREVQTHLSTRLAKYKIPRLVRVIDAVERSGVGKVNKKKLAKQIFADYF
jgi:acyl-CoA synthetase (AMP-forming)/AMP-acid ligase II